MNLGSVNNIRVKNARRQGVAVVINSHAAVFCLLLACMLPVVLSAQGTATVQGAFKPNTLDERVLTVPAPVQNGAFRDPATFLPQLVDYLTKDRDNPFVRVKALHDWVAHNIAYDTAAFFSGRISSQDADRTLQTRKAVCSGYAGLLQRLFDLAKVESRIITGYGRGYGYQPGEKLQSNHAWNAVLIDGAWYLLDPTWNSGYVGDDQKFYREYSTGYLFTDPYSFLHTHFPDNAADQLLAKPLTAQDFEKLPYLRGEFFSYGLSFASAVTEAEGNGSLDLIVPAGVQLLTQLTNAQGRELADRTLIATNPTGSNPNLKRIAFNPQGSGAHLLRLFARSVDSGSAQFEWVGDITVAARSGRADAGTFPLLYGTWFENEVALLSPARFPLSSTADNQIRIRMPKAKGMFLQDGNRRVAFASDGSGVWSVSFKAKANTRYQVFVDLGSGQYTGLLQF